MDGEDVARPEGPGGRSDRRVGDAERGSAAEALRAHLRAGRLTSREYEDRAMRAGAARTGAELLTLFDDLPEPHPAVVPAAPAVPPVEPVHLPAHRPATGPWDRPAHRWGADRTGAIMAVVPLIAVLLFFVTRTWVWFLLIPIVAVLVKGGPGGRRGC